MVHLHIRGQAGGDWSVVRNANGWSLAIGAPAAAAARVELGEQQAWRLFTMGITPQQALAEAKLDGDREWWRTQVA